MSKLRILGVIGAVLLGSVSPALSIASQPAGAVVPVSPTIVSLTFDDGIASQSVVPAMLEAAGMRGTFYVNTPQIGVGGFLSWANLTAYQTAGHEIGGHTLTHPNLTTIPLQQAGTEICQDRANLAAHGINAYDFAYPYGFGYQDPALVSIVSGCGYNSARRANGLYSAAPECVGGNGGCGFPYANALPESEPYAIRAGDNVQKTMSLADIELLVTQAEDHGGGWVPIVFHNICDQCDPYSVTQATLQSFLDWLKVRGPNTTVQTVHQVTTGALKPLDTTPATSTISCNSAACSANYYNTAVSVALAATDTQSGVAAVRYTTDGTDPTTTSTLYSAPISIAATTTLKYRAWDYAGNQESVKSQQVKVDSTAPVSAIACNGAACTVAPYAAPASVTLSSSDTGGSGVTSIRYTTDGTNPTAGSAIYSSPLSLGATTTVKYRAFDLAGNAEATRSQLVSIDTRAPVSSVLCNNASCGAGWYNAPVQLSLAASDVGGAGVAGIRYTTDGSDPTPSSTLYSTPFTVATATDVKYRATDNLGNVEATNTRPIRIDTISPVSSIACNNASCSTALYNVPVQVSLAATDLGGSGVGSVHYTTDGSDPTLASPVYGSPFTLTSTTTVKYRAFDVASNAEATNSVLVNVDAIAPKSSVTCNGKACSGAWYHGSVQVAIKATDAGSGVAAIHYTTDGSTPTAASPVYTKALKLTATRWVKVRTFDHAGNAGAVIANLVKIDNTGPSVTITSPTVHSLSANLPKSATLTLKATAKDAQTGIAKITIWVDGHLKATKHKAPFSYTWSVGKAKKGAHRLTVKVVDKSGNVTSKSITIVVH